DSRPLAEVPERQVLAVTGRGQGSVVEVDAVGGLEQADRTDPVVLHTMTTADEKRRLRQAGRTGRVEDEVVIGGGMKLVGDDSLPARGGAEEGGAVVAAPEAV